ncbi:MAG: hypothetical protein ACAH83_06715 [Alphaproteobacteria bacterium]
MNRNAALAATTAIILSFLAPAYAKGPRDDDKHHAEKAEAHAQQKAEKESEHAQRHEARKETRTEHVKVRQQKDEARETERLNKESARSALRDRAASQRLDMQEARQTDRLQSEQVRQTDRLQRQETSFQRKLSNQQFAAQQREQRLKFARELEIQKRTAQLRLQELRRSNRLANYRVQQDYFDRLERQRLSLVNSRDLSLFDTAYYNVPTYRYLRAGRYYETSRYGGSQLEQAVNYGCKEGYAAGVADRQDRWPMNITNSYIYQDANYGYSGILVPRDDYNYYFRQGYKRCYQNGYNGRGSSNSILESVLESVLGLQLLR